MATALVEMRGTTSPRLVLELVCARCCCPAAARRRGACWLGWIGWNAGSTGRPATRPGTAPLRRGPLRRGALRCGRPHRVPQRRVPQVTQARRLAQPVTIRGRGSPSRPGRSRWSLSRRSRWQPGGLDAAALRRVWPDVLEAVRARKRGTWTLIAQYVAGGDRHRARGHDAVLLAAPGIARSFATGVNVDVLKDALREVLGVDLEIASVGGDPAAQRRRPADPPNVAPSRSAPPPSPRSRPATIRHRRAPSSHGSDVSEPARAAIALARDGPGRRVIGNLDADWQFVARTGERIGGGDRPRRTSGESNGQSRNVVWLAVHHTDP